MERLDTSPDAGEKDQLIPLRVIILYENLDTGKHAKRTYSYLADSLRGVCGFKVQLWKFNLLEDPQLRSLATEDAAEADIVIVASEGPIELPDAVRTWLELWLGSQGHPLALVALFENPEKAALVRDYLETVAKKGGVEFFAQPGSSSREWQWSPFVSSPRNPIIQP